MGITFDPELSDVTNDAYVSGSLSVTSTPVEAKVGAQRLSGRELLYIEHRGGGDVYYGPSGVTDATGAKLAKNQFTFLPVGSGIPVFLVTKSGNATVIVQEFA